MPHRKKAVKYLAFLLCCILLVPVFTSCATKTEFTILSGSENDTLKPILDEYAKKNNLTINMVYKGSLDIMSSLQSDDSRNYDAVWPANSLWIDLGDTGKKVRDLQSIMTSPIVFGIRKSLAEQLGFVGRDVSIRDILKAIEDKKLKFMMTSATQSNSGVSAYIGFIYALLNNPDTITEADLQNEQMKTELKSLLSGINRSSGSSGWLKDLFLQGNYDSMVNYESMIIEANQQLVKEGREPLYVIYPVDGLTVADSPLGYINNGDSAKEAVFLKLQQYLLSDAVQKQILELGRRTGFGGKVTGADKAVFNPDWGIDANKTISGLRMPASTVIMDALNLYQSELKKPSYTVYCLDFSGSMSGNGETQLKQAMETILNQQTARQYLLQATPDDVVAVIPFNDQIIDTWKVEGNDEGKLQDLLSNIESLSPGGGTDIYSPAISGLDLLKTVDTDKYAPAVVLLTDGNSNTGKTYNDLQNWYRANSLDIPIFSIEFGSASADQLNQMASVSKGKVFDGRSNMVSAFKQVRGYN